MELDVEVATDATPANKSRRANVFEQAIPAGKPAACPRSGVIELFLAERACGAADCAGVNAWLRKGPVAVRIDFDWG